MLSTSMLTCKCTPHTLANTCMPHAPLFLSGPIETIKLLSNSLLLKGTETHCSEVETCGPTSATCPHAYHSPAPKELPALSSLLRVLERPRRLQPPAGREYCRGDAGTRHTRARTHTHGHAHAHAHAHAHTPLTDHLKINDRQTFQDLRLHMEPKAWTHPSVCGYLSVLAKNHLSDCVLCFHNGL